MRHCNGCKFYSYMVSNVIRKAELVRFCVWLTSSDFLMSTFFVVSYCISLTLSLITFITGIYVGIKRIHTLQVLPRALRLYLMTCCFPYFFITSICTCYVSIVYLLYHSQTHFTIEIVRNIITFSSQSIRNAFILIVFERIIATIRLEAYTMSDKNALFWRLVAVSYTTSTFYLGYNLYAKSMPDQPWLYNITNYYVYCAHMFMLSVCAVLYFMNRKLYKFSAYRITLKRRYTIAQNIKILQYLFPSILIYSLCAQFGSMITIIFQALNLPTAPLSAFHIFFNLSFLLIYFRHYCIHSDKTTATTTRVINVSTVKNPLGKNIPVNVTADQYFDGLQHQWK